MTPITTCIVCTISTTGLVKIYNHPNDLDKMITFISNHKVSQYDHLCVRCYEELKIAFDFKRKCQRSHLYRSVDEGPNSIAREVTIAPSMPMEASASSSVTGGRNKKVNTEPKNDTQNGNEISNFSILMNEISDAINQESNDDIFHNFDFGDHLNDKNFLETLPRSEEPKHKVEERPQNAKRPHHPTRHNQFDEKHVRIRSDRKQHMHSCEHTGNKMFAKNCNCSKSCKRPRAGKCLHYCDFCPKKFCKLNSYKKHVLQHTLPKPFECYECGKNINCPRKLRIHRRIHT